LKFALTFDVNLGKLGDFFASETECHNHSLWVSLLTPLCSLLIRRMSSVNSSLDTPV
jgi:hypothetical protein